MIGYAIGAVERGLVPDPVVRWGIRRLCARRLKSADPGDPLARRGVTDDFLAEMAELPVAPFPEKANEQHYELPADFFGLVLGPRRKYSCCWWPGGVQSLAGAEEAALAVTARRAGIEDGQRILELGCGWGSLTLWIAERNPRSRITAVSNSVPQRRWIEAEVRRRGLTNVEVLTVDMNDFSAPGRYDRIISVEMFEHMSNWGELLRRIAGWLEPDGRLFVHVFGHRAVPYRFDAEGAANWMGRHFFTGGIMPSRELIYRYPAALEVVREWSWSGEQYRRTADAWLANLEARRGAIVELLAAGAGPEEAERRYHRWRLFFLSCSELFGYRGGREWRVWHYLLRRPAGGRPAGGQTSAIDRSRM